MSHVAAMSHPTTSHRAHPVRALPVPALMTLLKLVM
jgi:hypothetical protein